MPEPLAMARVTGLPFRGKLDGDLLLSVSVVMMARAARRSRPRTLPPERARPFDRLNIQRLSNDAGGSHHKIGGLSRWLPPPPRRFPRSRPPMGAGVSVARVAMMPRTTPSSGAP